MNKVVVLSRPASTGFTGEWFDLATTEHFWVQWRMRAFLRQLRELGVPAQEPWRGLDVGCGTGVVCRPLEGLTRWSIDGADVDEKALSLHPPGRGRTLLYDIRDRLPEMSEAYDFILLFDVLEHIEDPGAYLESALHHLRPGGWVFVNVPAFERLRSRYDTVVGHKRRYDKAGMREELGRRRLEIRDLRYWGLSMIPALILRKLRPAGGSSPTETMRSGFQPPASLHALLKLVMRAETSLLSRPPAGTSLLAAAVKPPRG